jgi:hypothetical protein
VSLTYGYFYTAPQIALVFNGAFNSSLAKKLEVLGQNYFHRDFDFCSPKNWASFFDETSGI